MKSSPDDNPFNTPEEMLIRAAYLMWVAGFAMGIVLVLLGAMVHDLRILAGGFGALVLATLGRAWLKHKGQFSRADMALNEFVQPGAAADAAKVAELVRLLRQWDDMERKRGSPAFDPWTLQAIRHDIREMVDADPALEGLFHDRRSAA